MNWHQLRIATTLLGVMTAVLGLAYPAMITAVAAVAFADQARGSLIFRDGHLVGSRLIGQNFEARGHFWGRPSATTPQPYNALASNGSNLGPLNPALIDLVKANVARLRQDSAGRTDLVPVDLVTASASGLDPEISPEAARFQVPRIARAHGVDPARIEALIASHQHPPTFGFVGAARVNVLELNLALDESR